MLFLDSGAVSWLAQPDRQTAARVQRFRQRGEWPPVVPSVVIVESLTGSPGRDAITNRLLKSCQVEELIPERLARRAAQLRTKAGCGSAVDAVVVALAEPGGTVLTSDPVDLKALSAHAVDVAIEVV